MVFKTQTGLNCKKIITSSEYIIKRNLRLKIFPNYKPSIKLGYNHKNIFISLMKNLRKL